MFNSQMMVLCSFVDIEERMTFRTLKVSLVDHVVFYVIAGLSQAESRKCAVDKTVEVGPLVQTKSHTFRGGFDVLRVVGLVPLSEVDALVSRRYADMVTVADVMRKLYVLVSWSYGFDVFADVLNSLPKCRPSTRKQNRVSGGLSTDFLR